MQMEKQSCSVWTSDENRYMYTYLSFCAIGLFYIIFFIIAMKWGNLHRLPGSLEYPTFWRVQLMYFEILVRAPFASSKNGVRDNKICEIIKSKKNFAYESMVNLFQIFVEIQTVSNYFITLQAESQVGLNSKNVIEKKIYRSRARLTKHGLFCLYAFLHSTLPRIV